MNHTGQLTILTVAGPGDEQYVRANIALTKALNPQVDINFVVIDNGLTGPQGIGIGGRLDATVIPGVAQSMDKPQACRGSYQHSEALNAYLHNTPMCTQYLLVLDPDFYIVVPNWISLVIGHMDAHELAFFGSPWHPKWYSKYRNFPSVHCMFVDTNRVSPKLLDFVPDLVKRAAKAERRESKLKPCSATVTDMELTTMGSSTLAKWEVRQVRWWILLCYMMVLSLHALVNGYVESKTPIPSGLKLLIRMTQLPGKIRKGLRLILGMLVSLTINRRFIKNSNDTGYKIEQRFSKSLLGMELIQPVVHYRDDFAAAKHLRLPVGRFIESMLPDRWSYVPKRSGYYVEHGFHCYGLPDVTHLKWEEFIWNNAPFGFHLRRFNKKTRDVKGELEQIDRVLSLVLERASSTHPS